MDKSIHFKYIIGFLIVIIICLLTIELGTNEKLVDYISFALTITSLFLALISIIYGFYSNSSLSQNLTYIQEASNKVGKASEKLKQTAVNLDKKIDSIPILIQKIEGKVDSTHNLMLQAYENGLTPQKQTTNTEIPDEIIQKFYEYVSPMGLYALYAITISYLTQKTFKLDELEEKVPLLREDYTNGFLVASSSFGLFVRLDYSDTWKIVSVNEKLLNFIEKTIDSKAQSMKTEDNEYLNYQKQLIHDFFTYEKN